MIRTAPSAVELVAMVAALMSMNALAIDVMLPALPAIGQDLGVVEANQTQYVVIAFALGMGFGQLVFGPLSDRFGRRPVLLISIGLYALFGLGCALPGSFGQLVGFRMAQGLASAGGRAISVSIVRDLHRGNAMARIMSLVVVVFMVVPIAAPSLGWVVLQFGSWRLIFWGLVGFGLLLGCWIWARLPETHAPANRRPFEFKSIATAYSEVVRQPDSLRYTLASGFVFGCLFGFISSSEQLFSIYGRQDSFPLYFAGVAASMALAAFANAWLVERLGARRISGGAATAFVIVQVTLTLLLNSQGSDGLQGFSLLYGGLLLAFFCVGLMGANFNALALEPLGHIAGTASAAVGFASTAMASVLGGLVGQQFDGTPVPLSMGFAVLATAAWLTVNLRGRPRAPVVAVPSRG
ncbi:MAG: multidrug effflux MFS transporter [Myxococcota bacterium]